MKNQIEKAIIETLVIENKQSVHIAVDKIMDIVSDPINRRKIEIPDDTWIKIKLGLFGDDFHIKAGYNSGAKEMREKILELNSGDNQMGLPSLSEEIEQHKRLVGTLLSNDKITNFLFETDPILLNKIKYLIP